MIVAALFSMTMPAAAQDTDSIASELEDRGYYIEPGAEGTDSGLKRLNETSLVLATP